LVVVDRIAAFFVNDLFSAPIAQQWIVAIFDYSLLFNRRHTLITRALVAASRFKFGALFAETGCH
jgi:hypothetical protein